jgi:biopolymer transport protein ExbB
VKDIYHFLFVKGGPVMFPIMAGSVLALALFLERLWALRRERVLLTGVLNRVRARVRDGQFNEAEVVCQENGSPLASVIGAGVRRAGQGREGIKEGIMEVGRREVVHMERFVELLGTIATVEPLLGLLGTVTGLIRAFQQVEALAGRGSGVNPSALAGGIWEALITTAAGLTIGIPAYLGYKYLLTRVDHLAVEIEEEALEMADLIASKGPSAAAASGGT